MEKGCARGGAGRRPVKRAGFVCLFSEGGLRGLRQEYRNLNSLIDVAVEAFVEQAPADRRQLLSKNTHVRRDAESVKCLAVLPHFYQRQMIGAAYLLQSFEAQIAVVFAAGLADGTLEGSSIILRGRRRFEATDDVRRVLRPSLLTPRRKKKKRLQAYKCMTSALLRLSYGAPLCPRLCMLGGGRGERQAAGREQAAVIA